MGHSLHAGGGSHSRTMIVPPGPLGFAYYSGDSRQNPAALVGGQTLNALASNFYAQASQDLVDFLYDYFPRAVSPLRPFLTSNNIAVERKRFLELGGFDASFPFAAAEDRDYSERWTAAGGSLVYEPEAKIEHFQDLTLKQFCTQHHTYGRGAARLSRVRALGQSVALGPNPFASIGRCYLTRSRSIRLCGRRKSRR